LGFPGQAVAFRPDGEILATANCVVDIEAIFYTCAKSEIHFWRLEDFAPAGEPLTGLHGPVHALAFSPSGEILASVGCAEKVEFLCVEPEIRLWQVSFQSSNGNLTEDSAFESPMAIIPSASVLADAEYDVVRLWDIRDGDQMGKPLTGHEAAILSLASSMDGRLLASGGLDRTIRIWDREGGMQVQEISLEDRYPIISLAFSPDGARLASGGCVEVEGKVCQLGKIRIWDVQTGELLGDPLFGHEGGIVSLSFHPNGELLASGSRDATVRLWDISTRQQIGEPLSGHLESITSVAFSPDGSVLASGSRDGTFSLWDTETGELIRSIRTGQFSSVLSVAWSPGGGLLATGMEYHARLWDPNTGLPIGQPFAGILANPVLKTFPSGQTSTLNVRPYARIFHVDFSADGKTLAGSGGGGLYLWDMDVESWMQAACDIAGRNLSQQEWRLFLPEQEYKKTCVQWPEGA
jgi:WD40 repeat protein